MEKQKILDELLEILTKHLKISVDFSEDYQQNRRLFRGLCNQCLTLKGIDEKFYKLQDELLSIEREEKGVINVQNLEYRNGVTLWQGDITRLNADAIVNAANNEYLGCFVPCHTCIDNIIMSASGFQMREELLILKENSDYERQKVKVTSSYNLPCKFVFHTAGPMVYGSVTKKDKKDLMQCYLNSLEEAKHRGINSIAFCCISTGLYLFPNKLACEIAVNSVKNWLIENNSKIKVVFNVFKDIDRELYEKELSR